MKTEIVCLIFAQYFFSQRSLSLFDLLFSSSLLNYRANHFDLTAKVHTVYLAAIHQGQTNSQVQCQLCSPHPSLTLSLCFNPFYSCPAQGARITQMPSHPLLLLQPHMHVFSLLSNSLQICSHNPSPVKCPLYVLLCNLFCL